MGEESKDFTVTDHRAGSEQKGQGTDEQSAGPDQEARQEVREQYEKVAAKEERKSSCPLPKVDIGTFVLSISSSVLVHLGEVPDPESGRVSESLDMAKHTIDILIMLEEKTRGNLTRDEERLVKDVLFELRLKYVQKLT